MVEPLTIEEVRELEADLLRVREWLVSVNPLGERLIRAVQELKGWKEEVIIRIPPDELERLKKKIREAPGEIVTLGPDK